MDDKFKYFRMFELITGREAADAHMIVMREVSLAGEASSYLGCISSDNYR